MSPWYLHHTNPDAIFCLIILLAMPAFAVGAVYYSVVRGNCERLRRPSWDRHPINWWADPLQSLFISTWVISAMAGGSVVRLSGSGEKGFWMFAFFLCFAVGLAIGQFIVYKIFRDRIKGA